MSLKALELQIAIPRAVDAGRMQEQLLQRGNIEQFDQALLQRKEQDTARLKTAEVYAIALPSIQKEEKKTPWKTKARTNRGGARHNHGKTKKTDAVSHPYKGKYIDYSL